MPVMLQRRYGIKISQKKCARLKKQLGLRTLYPHRNTSAPNPRAEKKDYQLKDIEIKRIDQVWTSDITYIQIEQKNYYLCVILDWDSRYVLGWSMGRNMDVGLCLKALGEPRPQLAEVKHHFTKSPCAKRRKLHINH